MLASDFIRKWERSKLKESASAQSHFNDLCDLLEVEKPTDADAVGDSYCFEKGATKSTGGNGFADVWKKGCFGWEYKGPNANLDTAYAQLQRYAVALENPPLLIVSDTKTIIIRTNWTNTVSEIHTINLTDLVHADVRERLRNCFVNPVALKPKRTRDELTKEAADEFSTLAQRLRERGNKPEAVAHFVNRMVFCMFAEDVKLLPNKLFQKAMERSVTQPARAQKYLSDLFAAMQKGGEFGLDEIPWFNGGLFDSSEALPLEREDIELAVQAAKLDWSDIDPSILGTLFERGLDPAKRSQLGAHYTDREKIMMIIQTVIIEPLEHDWDAIRIEIETIIDAAPKATKDKLLRGKELAAQTRALKKAEGLHRKFVRKLEDFRVLDPACGSGNFLYLSLKALKDIEHKANVEAEALGLPRGFPRVGPEAVKGIEINPYAAELARVSIWIGEIQWMRANGFEASTNPILKPLENVECRDALLNPDGTRADWPGADVVVGNPPFLGNKKMIGELGEAYVQKLRSVWKDIPGGVDLVTYWFVASWKLIESGVTERVGLVSTNSIRSGTNRDVLKPIVQQSAIYRAWDDEEWTVDGADVRVSLVCFDEGQNDHAQLNNDRVTQIFSDLSARDTNLDLTNAKRLHENLGVAFQGTIKTGPFEVSGDLARAWLKKPLNANGKPNSDVLKPWMNGMDLTRRNSGQWIIDFGVSVSERDAAFYQEPFEYLKAAIEKENQKRASKDKPPLRGRELRALDGWWLHQRARGEMRQALRGLSRFVATARVSKHRLFTQIDSRVLPDTRLVIFALEDESFFGIIHSKFHEVWTIETGGWHGVGNDPQYTPSLSFETFPFPDGLTPHILAAGEADNPQAQAIATAAARLNELRENWLNPADLVKRVPEVVTGYPDRILPVDGRAAEILKKRTLTNLYNERPAWLDHAHYDLDRAVAAAYGWEDDFDVGKLTDEEILKRLFELNQLRAAE